MKKLSKKYLIFCVILFGIFLLRLPSLFEPYWYGDEGIFAAVGRNLNLGGVLYQTAWDNKPPMIYLTYAAVFKSFGVSMFNLHLLATIAVLATATIIYEVVEHFYGSRRALIAMGLFGFLSSLRVFEGNLALTEIFMILPISLAILIAIKRKFDYLSLLIAGILFAIASLYKQVGAFEAAALGIYLFFQSKNFKIFLISGLFLTLGFTVPYAVTFAYFAKLNLISDFIFAAYAYYRIYLNESPQYALLINVLKYLPVFLAIAYGFYKKRKKEVTVFNLFALWLSFSFLGGYFSGRAYGHYIIQSLSAFSVVLATISFKKHFNKIGAIFGLGAIVILLILTKFLFPNLFVSDPFDQFKYYQNFSSFVIGNKSVDEYNNFFDRNVNAIMAAADVLKTVKAEGKSVYIWGDLPWIYAITDVINPSRYVTSFHVFGVPNGKEEVLRDVTKSPPVYILKPPGSIGYFEELEKLIAANYTWVSTVQDIKVYALKDKSKK